MADKDDKQLPKSSKEREKILERKYKNYGINRNSPTSSPTKPESAPAPSFYEVRNRRSGEKVVDFDDDEKASYAPLTPDKKQNKGGLFSRIMRRLSTDKTKEDLAKDDEEEEDVGYVNQWEEEEEDEEEDKEAAAGEGGASTAMGADTLAQKFKGLDFGKDELTKD